MRLIARARRQLARATSTSRARVRLGGAIRRIDRAVHTAAGAERKGRIAPACADALASLLGTAHTRAQGLLTGR